MHFEIGEITYNKVYVERDWDGNVYLVVRNDRDSTGTVLLPSEAKKLIKALKSVVKGGK